MAKRAALDSAQTCMENAAYLISNLRGMLGLLRHSGQSPSEVESFDLEGTFLVIDYVMDDIEDNVREAISKTRNSSPAIQKGA